MLSMGHTPPEFTILLRPHAFAPLAPQTTPEWESPLQGRAERWVKAGWKDACSPHRPAVENLHCQSGRKDQVETRSRNALEWENPTAGRAERPGGKAGWKGRAERLGASRSHLFCFFI